MLLNIVKLCLKEMVKIYFGLLKTHVKFLIKKSKGFLAFGLSTYFCLFDLILYDPVNNFSVMLGPIFLC